MSGREGLCENRLSIKLTVQTLPMNLLKCIWPQNQAQSLFQLAFSGCFHQDRNPKASQKLFPVKKKKNSSVTPNCKFIQNSTSLIPFGSTFLLAAIIPGSRAPVGMTCSLAGYAVTFPSQYISSASRGRAGSGPKAEYLCFAVISKPRYSFYFSKA